MRHASDLRRFARLLRAYTAPYWWAVGLLLLASYLAAALFPVLMAPILDLALGAPVGGAAGAGDAASAGLSLRNLGATAEAFAADADAVVICSPTSRHVDRALAALRRGWHVFVEKPLAHTLEGTAALVDEAARATIAELREKNVIEHLWRQGTALRDGYAALAREHGIADRTRCVGFPPRTVLTFKDATGADSLAMKSLFHQEMIKRGILTSGGFNLCYAHSDEDVRLTLAACGDALSVLAGTLAEDQVEAALEGPAIQPVFRSA